MKVVDQETALTRKSGSALQFQTAFVSDNPTRRGTLVWFDGGMAMLEAHNRVGVGVESVYLELPLEDVIVERLWDSFEDVEDLLAIWFENDVPTLKTTYDSLADDPLVFSIDVNESLKEMDVICV